MITMNHQQAYDALKARIKTLCDKLFEPNIPLTIRGASNQKLTSQYIQLNIRDWDRIGWYDVVAHNTNAVKYEVSVDIGVHRPPSSTTVVGSTTIAANRIQYALTASTGTYLDTFLDGNISHLRSSRVMMRHWPIDRTQLEERSTFTAVFEVLVVETDANDVGEIQTVELSGDGHIRIYTTEETIAVEEQLDVTYP